MSNPATDTEDHRHALRRRAFIAAKIVYQNGAVAVDCVIRNISATGAKIDVSESIVLPSHFDIVIPQKNVSHRAELRWRHGGETGVAFLDVPEGEGDADRHPAAAPAGAPPVNLAEDALRTRIRTLEQEIVRLKARIVQLGG